MSAAVGGSQRAEFTAAGVTFLLCVGVSLWANVATAAPSGAARAVQGWPVVAVVVAEILVLWIPGKGWQARARQVLAAGLGVLALAMSYRHMRSQAIHVGLAGWEADVWPLTVDGLLVLAGLALHELWPSVSGRRPERRAATSKKITSRSTNTKRTAATAAEGSTPATTTATSPVGSGRGMGGLGSEQVVALAAAQPELTAKEMGEVLGVSDRTIRRLKRLARENADIGNGEAATSGT